MKNKLTPYKIILLSYLAVIILGSVFLILPFSTKDNVTINYIDALFMSTSSVTITGLSPLVIKDTFSTFGKSIIVILTQIGGLSVTTITYFIITLLGAKIGFGSRKLALENINLNSMSGVVKVIKNVVKVTLIIELIGIILFTIMFYAKGFSLINSFGNSIFHTVASYNNSGMDILGNNSLIVFKSDFIFSLVTIILVLLGSLGSIVIYDILEKRSYRKLSFHSKIVLKMTLILVVFGALTFFLLEKDATILESLFHSASLRTAGFYTYDYNTVRQTTLLIMMFLMFIGGAPASNAGGVKVTTLYTLYKSTLAFIKDKEPIAYKRRIPLKYQYKAFMVVFIAAFIIMISVILISYYETNVNLTNIMFEVISSFSSTGISLGLTKTLSGYSKVILIVVMLIGRVGVLTFVNSLLRKKLNKPSSVEYIDIEYIV